MSPGTDVLATHELLREITLVLCVAAARTVLFQRLRQPVVLGYLLAGLIVGPHVPIPLVAHQDTIRILSELGVILLMFSLGLEFSMRRLVEVAPTAGVVALVQTSFMVWLGFIAGRAFGWTVRESVFAGAIVAISSTTIIAKAFEEQKIGGKLRELVVSVLIVEDLIAILLLAVLTALSAGDTPSARTILASGSRLAAFLAGFVAIGMLVVPRMIRAVCRLRRPETLLVSSVGLCFAAALLAERFGYSVALGAFIAGSLVAESGEEKEVEHLILPVRDVFGAIFFVSVGMMFDPAVVVHNWAAVLVFTALVIAGKLLGVSVGAFLTGHGTRMSVQAGMSLAQIGEFSFIIAGVGLSLGATRELLYPIAVAVSAITTLTTPWLIRSAGRVAMLVDRKLPRPLQTFAALYGTWIERMRSARAKDAGLADPQARQAVAPRRGRPHRVHHRRRGVDGSHRGGVEARAVAAGHARLRPPRRLGPRGAVHRRHPPRHARPRARARAGRAPRGAGREGRSRPRAAPRARRHAAARGRSARSCSCSGSCSGGRRWTSRAT
jgi:CPA2 family monovalent cation:H+ antiporter-2